MATEPSSAIGASARNVTSVAAAVARAGKRACRIARDAGREKVISDTLAGESHAERMMAALNVMKDAFCYYDSSDRLVLYNEAMVDLYRGLARRNPARHLL